MTQTAGEGVRHVKWCREKKKTIVVRFARRTVLDGRIQENQQMSTCATIHAQRLRFFKVKVHAVSRNASARTRAGGGGSVKIKLSFKTKFGVPPRAEKIFCKP
jgi:hypothetical protein